MTQKGGAASCLQIPLINWGDRRSVSVSFRGQETHSTCDTSLFETVSNQGEEFRSSEVCAMMLLHKLGEKKVLGFIAPW